MHLRVTMWHISGQQALNESLLEVSREAFIFLIFREQKWLALPFHLLLGLSKNVMSGAEATFFRSWSKKQENHKDISSEISEPLNQHWQPTPFRLLFLWEKWKNLICLSHWLVRYSVTCIQTEVHERFHSKFHSPATLLGVPQGLRWRMQQRLSQQRNSPFTGIWFPQTSSPFILYTEVIIKNSFEKNKLFCLRLYV